jgi:hypothetical protein
MHYLYITAAEDLAHLIDYLRTYCTDEAPVPVLFRSLEGAVPRYWTGTFRPTETGYEALYAEDYSAGELDATYVLRVFHDGTVNLHDRCASAANTYSLDEWRTFYGETPVLAVISLTTGQPVHFS